MIEIIGLIIAIGTIARIARRRGGYPWLWGGLALGGYLSAAFLFTLLLPDLVSVYLLVGWGWVGLMMLAAYLTGGIRTAGVSWQCHQCGLYNDPSTLICDCGQAYPI